MQNLIEVKVRDNGSRVVSGRGLHEYLKIKTDFVDWIKRMIEYGFEEGADFLKIEETVSQGVARHEYILKLDMAKELSMIQRSEQGKAARQYFIACEEELRSRSAPVELTRLELLEMALESEKSRLILVGRISEMQPKVKAAEILLISEDTVNIGEFAKTIGYGQNTLFQKLREDKFLIPDGGKKNLPYQKWIDQGLFVVVEVTKIADNKVKLFSQTQITSKGQVYLSNKYAKQ